jgi:MATE family multidrug resistance protein
VAICSTHLLEYSLVIASVVSVGHLSTEGLAASTLGSMTASVSGLSIVQGFASALDSLLPQAWTSDRPENVGLWTQRMVVVMALLCMVSRNDYF